MTEQRENNWDKRYLEKDYPWEEETPSSHLLESICRYVKRGARVLEIGCGLGTNAIWLAGEGFKVDALDVSHECVRLARTRLDGADSQVNFFAFDFMNGKLGSKYDLVFERGCFHSFKEQSGLNLFAEKVAESLEENGIWLTLTGNADNPDNLEKRRRNEYPRISLRALAEAAEPHFEALEISRTRFGVKNAFLAWQGVFRKRSFFY